MKQLELNLWGEQQKEHPKTREITHQAKSYTGLYGLHKYWGKKPYNVMSDLIEEYTSPNEIVLDPFLGSGVSVTEAIFNQRKGFGIDINPSAIFIAEQIIAKINL
ncbi:MAG: site-specific DNA-methyltransferase, partial [Okeania sp. SIO2H7]|nr:site-specific DNA-methyltransferase [Okeania sp. SIO2H7]